MMGFVLFTMAEGVGHVLGPNTIGVLSATTGSPLCVPLTVGWYANRSVEATGICNVCNGGR